MEPVDAKRVFAYLLLPLLPPIPISLLQLNDDERLGCLPTSKMRRAANQEDPAGWLAGWTLSRCILPPYKLCMNGWAESLPKLTPSAELYLDDCFPIRRPELQHATTVSPTSPIGGPGWMGLSGAVSAYLPVFCLPRRRSYSRTRPRGPELRALLLGPFILWMAAILTGAAMRLAWCPRIGDSSALAWACPSSTTYLAVLRWCGELSF